MKVSTGSGVGLHLGSGSVGGRDGMAEVESLDGVLIEAGEAARSFLFFARLTIWAAVGGYPSGEYCVPVD